MYQSQRRTLRSPRLRQRLQWRKPTKPILTIGIVAFGIIGLLTLSHAYAATAKSELQNGLGGTCLQSDQSLKAGSPVTAETCDASAMQQWQTTDTTIVNGTGQCLDVRGDATNATSQVVEAACTLSPGEVWIRDQSAYYNPNSGLCLTNQASRVTITSCDTASASQHWTPYSLIRKAPVTLTCDGLQEGQKVACVAIKNWNDWQSPSSDHTALLTAYTDGNSYEAWCADFVSSIYKEAGFALTNGERDGWDEYAADGLQYDGFTVHYAGSYTPRPGDIAYFNYPGGHVEIVVSGGATPTYVYGNSAQTDSQTGNGDMAADTIQSLPQLGTIAYYLSPNK